MTTIRPAAENGNWPNLVTAVCLDCDWVGPLRNTYQTADRLSLVRDQSDHACPEEES